MLVNLVDNGDRFLVTFDVVAVAELTKNNASIVSSVNLPLKMIVRPKHVATKEY
jgi:hypothetical protein